MSLRLQYIRARQDTKISGILNLEVCFGHSSLWCTLFRESNRTFEDAMTEQNRSWDGCLMTSMFWSAARKTGYAAATWTGATSLYGKAHHWPRIDSTWSISAEFFISVFPYHKLSVKHHRESPFLSYRLGATFVWRKSPPIRYDEWVSTTLHQNFLRYEKKNDATPSTRF